MVKLAIFIVAMCMAAMAVMLSTPHAEAAISCGQVVSSLEPCISYVTKGGSLPTPCCDGIKTLNSQASTTPDRQAACNCIKSAAESINGINLKTAASLPSDCGVNLPYDISPSINCTTVH